MYSESLNKIIAMVKMSEALDQTGYVDESVVMLYNAFDLSEQTVLKMAAELDGMVKSASVGDRKAKLEELENMAKTANALGNALRSGLGWGAKGLKWLGDKIGLGGKPGAAVSRAGEFLDRAGKDSNKAGLINKFWNQGQKAIQKQINPDRLALEKRISELSSNGRGMANASEIAKLKAKILKIPEYIPGQEAIKGGLTDLGKLGVGTAALGTAGAAAMALGGRGQKPGQPQGGIPQAGALDLSRQGGGMAGGMQGGGMQGGGMQGGMSGGSSQIMAIESRIQNLEQVVNQIRSKVGV